MRPLDFIIIGAQKSGTTTLFQLLSEHPDVYVPPGKELPFFNRDGANAASYAAFMEEHFGGQSEDVVIGKVTPHYLSDPAVAERLGMLMPSTRLVVILRDPVERAFSHYRMSVRRELDKRSFPQAVDDMLSHDNLARARALPAERGSEHQTYVAWGEYGRLLRPYRDQIARGALLVLSTRELETDPASTIARLLVFLGLEMVELPSLGQKIHQGGSKQRLPVQKIAKSIAPLRWLWRRLPHRYRSQVLFRVDQWNVVKSAESVDDLPAETVARLRRHFDSDAKIIEELTGWHPDWAR